MMALHDSGSGYGYPPIFTQVPTTGNMATAGFSTPPLISAKCWNNYENQNECRHLNVIGPGNDEGNNQNNQEPEDDSLITPVVIFESASSSSATSSIRTNYNNNDRYNYNNRYSSTTVATTTPDYGSTILPDLNWPRVRWGPRPGGSVAVGEISGDMTNTRTQLNNINPLDGDNLLSTTRKPKFSVFVVTQYPGNMQTTTSRQQTNNNKHRPTKPNNIIQTARKCLDENDSDCDEPDQPEGNDSDTTSNKDSEEGDDDLEDPTDQDANDDDGNDLTTLNKNNNRTIINYLNSHKPPGTSLVAETGSELGSGFGPNSSSSSNDDDDGPDELPDGDESSGHEATDGDNETLGEPNNGHNKFIQVPETQTNQQQNNSTLPTGSISSSSSATTTQGANIEVVVHPTLPPSFPIMNNPSVDVRDSLTTSSTTSTTTTTTTIMPDDTFRGKPIYPSSTENWDEEDALRGPLKSRPTSKPGDSNPEEDEDLNTFKPMPLPIPITQSPLMNNNQNFFPPGPATNNRPASDSKTPNRPVNSGNGLPPPSRHLWSTSRPQSSAPGLFGTSAPGINHPWGGKAGGGFGVSEATMPSVGPGIAVGPLVGTLRPANSLQQPLQQTIDHFPALILYGLIGTLAVTAFIMVVIAFGIWRKTVSRSKALIEKAHLMNNGAHLMNQQHHGGHGGTSMMQASLSHGSHLVSNMQPGLLSTYAPSAKILGKVTSTIVARGHEQDQLLHNGPSGATDDQMMLGMQAPSTSTNHSNSMDSEQQSDVSGKLDINSLELEEHQLQHKPRNPPIIASNPNDPSWTTTEDTQTGSGTTTSESNSSSAGSQASKVMLMNHQQQQQQHHHHQQQQQLHKQYQQPARPNSMSNNPIQLNRMIQFASDHAGWSSGSDGRQHTDSISDSQESQIAEGLNNQNNNINTLISYQQQQQNQQQQQQQANYVEQMAIGQQTDHMMPYQHQVPRRLPVMKQQPGFSMNSTRSIEDLQDEHEISIMEGLMMKESQTAQTASMGSYPHQLAGPASRLDFNKQQIPYQLNNNRVSINDPHDNHHRLMEQHQSLDPMNGLNLEPISSARIAMNPLATLSRRYPGLGLNRNILSEDTSSSLVTASPSLARTSSSSSSFALSHRAATNNGQFSSMIQSNSPALSNDNQNVAIRSKPILDESGRLVNDYTPIRKQLAFANSNSSISGPPIPGRKDRSEAWYV